MTNSKLRTVLIVLILSFRQYCNNINVFILITRKRLCSPLLNTTRPRHITYVLVWSKSDRRRLRKTLHKQTNRQTDTTKIMVTWPWTNSVLILTSLVQSASSVNCQVSSEQKSHYHDISNNTIYAVQCPERRHNNEHVQKTDSITTRGTTRWHRRVGRRGGQVRRWGNTSACGCSCRSWPCSWCASCCLTACPSCCQSHRPDQAHTSIQRGTKKPIAVAWYCYWPKLDHVFNFNTLWCHHLAVQRDSWTGAQLQNFLFKDIKTKPHKACHVVKRAVHTIIACL